MNTVVERGHDALHQGTGQRGVLRPTPSCSGCSQRRSLSYRDQKVAVGSRDGCRRQTKGRKKEPSAAERSNRREEEIRSTAPTQDKKTPTVQANRSQVPGREEGRKVCATDTGRSVHVMPMFNSEKVWRCAAFGNLRHTCTQMTACQMRGKTLEWVVSKRCWAARKIGTYRLPHAP